MIRQTTITVTGAAGGAGLATANTTSDAPINGTIKAVHLTYVGSPPAGTTDIVIAGVASPATEIITVSNAATSGWFYPMHQAQTSSAGADITNQGSPVVIDDYINAKISQANNDDGVTAVIIYET